MTEQPTGSDDEHLERTVANSAPGSAINPTPDEKEALLDAYDLDEDGKVSLVEEARSALGVVDARLEEFAEEHEGVVGKLADAAHKVVDKLDND
ncbi:hypothetical protein [Desertimonas flava]|jgi:hypothetical protein|uniref:hypothetical protein n=1 Tax=Desertimonas flava TaxID=2064846 RepID=UPI000E3495C7|nr:hypothetical protein [Desertimonas flava]